LFALWALWAFSLRSCWSLALLPWLFALSLWARSTLLALWSLRAFSLRSCGPLALLPLGSALSLWPLLALLARSTLATALTALAAFTWRSYWLNNSRLGDAQRFTTLARQYITAIDPDLDTNNPERCMRFGQAIINIGTQGLQRNFPLDFFL
jgi:hypothetical protein